MARRLLHSPIQQLSGQQSGRFNNRPRTDTPSTCIYPNCATIISDCSYLLQVWQPATFDAYLLQGFTQPASIMFTRVALSEIIDPTGWDEAEGTEAMEFMLRMVRRVNKVASTILALGSSKLRMCSWTSFARRSPD